MNLRDSPINRLPSGLLALLDIQSAGQTPNRLQDAVQPVLPMLEFYLQSITRTYQLTISTTVAAPSAGAQLAISATTPTDLAEFLVAGALVVPQQEVWLFRRATVFWQLPAVAAAFCRGQIDFNGANNPMLGWGWDTGSAAVSRFGYAAIANAPYILAQGGRYVPTHVGADNAGGAAITFGGNLEIARLRI